MDRQSLPGVRIGRASGCLAAGRGTRGLVGSAVARGAVDVQLACLGGEPLHGQHVIVGGTTCDFVQ